MTLSRSIAVVTVLGLAALVLRASAAIWVSPTLPEPSGNVAVPLNTSGTTQTKAGSLGASNLTIVDPQQLTIGRSGTTTRFCWNDDGTGTNCRSSWAEVSGLTGFLHLEPPLETDTGSVSLYQWNLGFQTKPATIEVTAGDPEPTIPTYAVWGLAADSTAGASTGIDAKASVNSPQQYAVVGSNNGFPNAWAGYFIGNVVVTSDFDLVVGNSTAQANATSEICFGGECKSSWPSVVGSGLWSYTGSSPNRVLKPNDTTKSITIANDEFRVDVSGADADLTSTGSGKFDQYVVGVPPAGIQPVITCGDGVCNGSENDTFGSPNYCPMDCDVTPPPKPEVEVLLNVSTREVIFIWGYPPDPDNGGTRIIYSNSFYGVPTGPFDTRGSVPVDKAYPIDTYKVGPLPADYTHYYAFYLYDTPRRNYSPGEIVSIRFSSGAPRDRCCNRGE